jgi:hypothetical protein
MFGVSVSIELIEAAPPEVRRWLEAGIACTLGLQWATHPGSFPLSHCNTKPSSGDTGEVKMDRIDRPKDNEALRKLIAVRAYELWESQGKPHGRDVINWHQAEQEIMSCVGDRDISAAHAPQQAR